LAVRLEVAIIDFLQGLDKQPNVFRGLPRIHQHGVKRQTLVIDRVAEQVRDMLKLGLAVAVGIVEPVVDQPELIPSRLHLDAGHGVMAEGVIVIGKIGQRVIDLADQQKWAIIRTGHRRLYQWALCRFDRRRCRRAFNYMMFMRKSY
jgi:hypothetical protein